MLYLVFFVIHIPVMLCKYKLLHLRELFAVFRMPLSLAFGLMSGIRLLAASFGGRQLQSMLDFRFRIFVLWCYIWLWFGSSHNYHVLA